MGNSRVLFTWMAALTLTGALSSLASAQRPIDETAQVSADGRVDIENLAGSVKVEGWDRNEISVTGTLAEDAEDFEFQADERRARLEVVFPARSRNLRHADSNLIVKVPVGSRVRVNGVSASIEVSAVTGPLDLETVSGELTITGEPSHIQAQTVSGDIRISGSSAEIDAASVSGDVVLEVTSDDVSASTVSGDISSTGGVFESVDFSTVSGRIEFTGAPTESGSLDFDCHSGSVVLVFPGDLSAEIEVSSFSGDIDNQFGPRPRKTNDYAPGKELNFTVGDGDARISVNSFSGRVRMSLE
jgi:DUF4097 and DUF4098 domain-containing protein YvlB